MGIDYPVIRFSQYHSGGNEDELLLFAAPARVIARWAGIPRKGWRVRMLYQRWLTPRREAELRSFWDEASTRSHGGYILGPTAITVGLFGDAKFDGNRIVLADESLLSREDLSIPNKTDLLSRIAGAVLPRVTSRLTEQQRKILVEFRSDIRAELPDVQHDYVLEFALQLQQMCDVPDYFVESNQLNEQDLGELIVALEQIARPALVVDGQHRLLGAAEAKAEVMLPVVAMPRTGWSEQIYQFIVINEKAQKVESSLLTDIMGSSLTQVEQTEIRAKFSRASVDVESRVAAVIANRDVESPFRGMVVVKLQGSPPGGDQPFITDQTIRLLIDGRTRGARGWRSDDEFYEYYVRPTIQDRAVWDSWSAGRWREYWFAFWRSVADHYNAQASKEKVETPLWDRQQQSNLTKGVALRLFQRLFMEKAVQRVRAAQAASQVLLDELGAEQANSIIERRNRREELVLPTSADSMAQHLQKWFFNPGVPVRLFLYPWLKSLDDSEGQDALWNELQKAYEAAERGSRYRASSSSVFASGEVEEK